MDRAAIGCRKRIDGAIVLSLVLVLAGFCQREDAGSPRAQSPLTILQINDVYSAQPIEGAGGLARVAALKQRVAAAGRTPLLILAGDFLSPSVESSVFKGEQMIAALNAAGVDLATLGNHEFDFGTDVLIKRMREAKWQWVISNVIDTNTNRPVGGAAPYVVRSFGALRVGFIGLCLDSPEINRVGLAHIRIDDPIQTAVRYVTEFKRQGVNVIVAITHLPFEDDRRLIERLPEIDLVIGGHEHYPITATSNRTLISKAGSDAKWVARIDVNRAPSGTLERFYELIPINNELTEDPHTAGIVTSYETKLGTQLKVVVGRSEVPLDGDSDRLRSGETNLGNLVADAMRADVKADVALVNAGGIRGDRVYPAGLLTRRTLVDIHPFGNVVCKVSTSGHRLVDALESGVSKLPSTAGQFPQVSGLTMRIVVSAPPGDRVRDVRVGGRPLDPDETYTIALPDYMLKGSDEYVMFDGERVLIAPEDGNLMLSALERFVAARKIIAPRVDGRITVVH